MRVGQNRSWEGIAKGATHAAVLEFANQDDLDYYLLKDPVHRAFSVNMAVLVEDVTVVDIRDGVLAGPTPRKPVGLGGVWKGTCHCGGCEWEVQSETQMKHVLCHCDTCKKLGGGPFSCNYIVPRENLEIIKGNPSVYAYKGASGKFVHCYFCPTCTSHIYHHQDVAPENIIVRTLLLDGGNDLDVGGEIFPEGQLAWANDLRNALNPTPAKQANPNGVNGV